MEAKKRHTTAIGVNKIVQPMNKVTGKGVPVKEKTQKQHKKNEPP